MRIGVTLLILIIVNGIYLYPTKNLLLNLIDHPTDYYIAKKLFFDYSSVKNTVLFSDTQSISTIDHFSIYQKHLLTKILTFWGIDFGIGHWIYQSSSG